MSKIYHVHYQGEPLLSFQTAQSLERRFSTFTDNEDLTGTNTIHVDATKVFSPAPRDEVIQTIMFQAANVGEEALTSLEPVSSEFPIVYWVKGYEASMMFLQIERGRHEIRYLTRLVDHNFVGFELAGIAAALNAVYPSWEVVEFRSSSQDPEIIDNLRLKVGQFGAGYLYANFAEIPHHKEPKMLYPTIDEVSSRLGAPMGRRSMGGELRGTAQVFRVPINGDGCDAGGAYWGYPNNLWCATDNEDFRLFTRADSLEDAITSFKEQSPHFAEYEHLRLLDLFTGFVEVALRDAYYSAVDDNDEPLQNRLHGAGPDDLDEDSVARVKKWVNEFDQALTKSGLATHIPDWHQAGYDLFYGMVGAGVGFWGRPELYGEYSDAISDLIQDTEVTVFLHASGEQFGIE